MRTRYRLPAGGGDTRARLERVLREVLDDGLESALARAGVAAHEEICIRSAHAPVRLSAASADSTLVAAWSVAIADSIHRAIQDGGAGVVRYATRNHALVDMLVGVAAGDLRRAWAWRQLDLWRASDAPSPAAAGADAARTLVAEGRSIVAALAGAARSGALPGLVAMLPRAAWVDIVRAALAAASLDAEPIVRALFAPRLPDATSAPETDAAAAARTASRARRALRLAQGSAIAAAMREVPSADLELRGALALLAVLEADPGELRRGAARAAELVLAVEAETRAEAPDATPRDAGHGARRADELAPRDRTTGEDHTAPPRRTERVAREPAERGRHGRIEGDADSRADEAEVRSRSDPHAAADPSEEARTEDERPLPELRARAVTEWGGLLFLLHVVDDLDLPTEIATAAVFRARSTRWVMHTLALSLLHLDERDPAALAFAGLAPDAELPWEGEDPATPEESRTVDALATRVAARAFERLRSAPPEDERAARAAVRACARRRAEIAAEPGWMDVMLRLDEVDVDVRRAGLDLDPGWIPSLGIVMRFVYG